MQKLFDLFAAATLFVRSIIPMGEAAWCAAAFLVRDMPRYPGRSRDARPDGHRSCHRKGSRPRMGLSLGLTKRKRQKIGADDDSRTEVSVRGTETTETVGKRRPLFDPCLTHLARIRLLLEVVIALGHHSPNRM